MIIQLDLYTCLLSLGVFNTSLHVVYHTSEPHSMEVDILSYYLASQSFDRNVLCTKLDTYVFYEQTKF
jgi:hypothetical protein